MKEIIFKRLEKEDIGKMQEILANDKIEYNVENITQFINNENNYGFIGIKENKVVAFLYGYGMLRPDGKSMFYIHSVDVISEYQSKGIGTRLMEVTLDYIKQENKYYKFFVLTEDNNIKACKLYQKYANRDKQVLFSNKI